MAPKAEGSAALAAIDQVPDHRPAAAKIPMKLKRFTAG
jgi:hypothetical protein